MLVAILGRQPKLSLAELESKFGGAAVRPIGEEAALVDTDSLDFEHFGGLIRSAKLLIRLENHDFRKAVDHIVRTLPEHIGYFAGRKIPFGLSVYGFDIPAGEVAKSAFNIKKSLNHPDKTLRVIENKTRELNAAQVLRNQLVKKGLELLLIRDGKDVILAQTTAIQDVDAYSRRDYDRPCRDPRVGMLPPKLAQIIINLATLRAGGTVLDPFCGTGVVLQEAVLMGFRAMGTDIDQRMIDCTRRNVIEWLPTEYPETFGRAGFEKGDATNMTWGDYPDYKFDCIASETYLGRPFSSEPDPQTLSEVVRDVDTTHKKFLQNVASQTKAGFRMCLAVPAWKTKTGFRHLPVLDRLTDLGYTRAKFVHADNEDLIYHREGQIVGRELLVLTRQ